MMIHDFRDSGIITTKPRLAGIAVDQIDDG